MKIGAETIFRFSRLACLAAQIVISVLHPGYLIAWVLSGIAVSAFYLCTQWAAASGRLGRATQDTYDRNTSGVAEWQVAVQCCVACLLAPPVWFIAIVTRLIRSARRLREQRQRGEPVAAIDYAAWAKAIRDE